MSGNLPDKVFTVERWPFVNHPEIYARVCLFCRSEPLPFETLCSSERSLNHLIDELA